MNLADTLFENRKTDAVTEIDADTRMVLELSYFPYSCADGELDADRWGTKYGMIKCRTTGISEFQT